MIERICPKCKVPMQGEKCIKPSCQSRTVMSTTIYWCEECNVPSFEPVCPRCGHKGKYIATDLRPVFPEEKLLLAIILKKDNPMCFEDASVWFGSGSYIIDGKKQRVSISAINKWSLDKIREIKNKYDDFKTEIEQEKFEKIIKVFVEVNVQRYNFITEEAIRYLQSYRNHYSIDDMMVSFSGGKDSTVTSHLVNKAFGTNRILHIFGDTTLEFPTTLEYKKRFKKNEESQGVQIITAKNREKNFEELCKIVGPPSRVMRWCCTVFKTGAIQKTISSAFKNKTNILTFYGIRRSESSSRSKYERESESPKISKQTVVSPIIDWIDYDVWLYILSTGIDFNDAYRLGFSRVGCWCCPNNGAWSEFLSKVHMYDKYVHWHDFLVSFAKKIGKPDAEEYVKDGKWKARQGGNGLEAAQRSVVSFEPCATDENAFNYELQRPIDDSLYELFKPFGTINKELGNKRLGEVYVINTRGKVALILQGRIGSNILKVIVKDIHIAKARTLSVAEGKVQCQLTKYQMCLGCKACESVCKHDAISVKDDGVGNISYIINNEKCVRCTECVGHFNAGCYMRKVLGIKRN
ncbi:MAG: phosphoadenosine phosphosulfate reductase family protein [Anaerostipes sp.]|nr:phosphoadenosine phosphosulfate reductase family protein [Anaerostipes sp.]MDD3746280.1 phosphoadenosine phosphosulfate reductase family protein [Anaerostipes sp.]